MKCWLWLAFLAASLGSAAADTVELPAAALERTGPVTAVYRLNRPASGTGVLIVDWTDGLGRVVMHRPIPVRLQGGDAIRFPLDLRRAVAMRNTLRAELVLGGYRGTAAVAFIARPPAAAWDDYQILMWQDRNPAQYARLRELGVTGGKVLGFRGPFTPAEMDARSAPLLQADLRWFVENIATDFYSAYHRWTPEHPQEVNWRFLALQQRYRNDPADRALLNREPGLSDPVWIDRIRERLQATVRAQRMYRPLYYDLGDETGIADLTAAWDFDFSPTSLAAFRIWLRARYPSLAALNRQWGSGFPAWDAVVPPTTTEAMRRSDQNFSGWGDFRAFMDASFAAALRAGTEAVHAVDPAALAAIEGAQVPGWGGYDYARLAGAVDAMEIGESDNNVEILRSLNPALVLLGTSGGSGPAAQRAIWHDLLLGERGLVIWDEGNEVATLEGDAGPRARADGATYAALRSGLGALLLASRARQDGVAILYSPASFRIQWLLDHRNEGDAWAQRGSERENEDNAVRVAMRRDAARLVHLGLQPRWVSPERLRQGVLLGGAVHALVLPQAIALSDRDIAEIRRFAAGGGVVLAEGETGRFDSHGLRRAQPGLAVAAMPESGAMLAEVLAKVGVVPGFSLRRADGGTADDVDIRVFRDGTVTLIGLQRGEAPDAASDIVLTLPRPVFMRDLGRGAWAVSDHVRLTLDPVVPTLLALSPRKPPPPVLAGPAVARVGENVELRLGLAGGTLATEVLHIEVANPGGRVMPAYSGNLVLHGARASWRVPLAVNDPTGDWTVRVHGVLSGGETAMVVRVGG